MISCFIWLCMAG